MPYRSKAGLAGWQQWMDRADRELLSHLTRCRTWKREVAEHLGEDVGTGPKDRGSMGEGRSAGHFPPPGRGSRARTTLARSSLNLIRNELRRAADERRNETRLLRELLAYPTARREAMVDAGSHFQTPEFVQRLLRACRDRWFTDALGAEKMARLAARVCAHLEPNVYTQQVVAELSCHAWAYLGNALRLQGRPRQAEHALHEAEIFVDRCFDLKIRVDYLLILSRLRGGQGRFEDSEKLIRRAVSLYRELGEDGPLAQALTCLGAHHLNHGSPERAQAPLREALRLVPEDSDPRTALNIRHNLTLALAESGRFSDAQQQMRECLPLYDQFPDSANQRSKRWLEALIATGLDDPERSESLLRGVLDGYVADGNSLMAALAGLDLAGLYSKTGQLDELRELAEELTVLCFSEDIPLAALTALHFFLEAVKADRATAGISKQVARFLKHSVHNPGARFTPPGG